MAKINKEYHNLLDKILQEGYKYEDPNREGVKRLEIPSYTFRHEFKDGFPAISTKKLHYKNVVTELLWFLKGDTNIKYLIDNGCNIWNKDAYKHYKGELTFNEWLFEIENNPNNKLGDLGPIYSKQWRCFGGFDGVDQIKDLIQGLKDKPLGTEHIVMAWNPADKHLMALPPCHYGFQIVVKPMNYKIIKGYKYDLKQLPRYGFELHWNQRSVDTFLG